MDVSYVDYDTAEVKILQELLSCFSSALYTETHNSACALRHVLLSQFVVLVPFQPRIDDPIDHRVIFQEFRYYFRILNMAFHSDIQCLQSLMCQIRVHRRHGAAQVSDHNSFQSCAECRLTKLFVEIQSMVTFIRSSHLRELEISIFIFYRPVEVSAFYNTSADAGSMSVRKFSRRMSYDMCAIFDWSAKSRCGKSIIHDERNFHLVCRLGELFDIQNAESRVAKRFSEECLCIRPLQLDDFLHFHILIKELHINSQSSERDVEQIVCSAVYICTAEHMISCFADIEQSNQVGGLTGRRCHSACTGFQESHLLFQIVNCRAAQSGIHMIRAVQIEEFCNIMCVVVSVSCTLDNRHILRLCAFCFICTVDTFCFKFLVFHSYSPCIP